MTPSQKISDPDFTPNPWTPLADESIPFDPEQFNLQQYEEADEDEEPQVVHAGAANSTRTQADENTVYEWHRSEMLDPQMFSATVRCESGYLMLGDPCYVLTPDASSAEVASNLTNPGVVLDALNANAVPFEKDTGMIFRATAGEISVLTLAVEEDLSDIIHATKMMGDDRHTESLRRHPHELNRVAALIIRLDGKTEALDLDTCHKEMVGNVGVDSGMMAVHDPAVTINGPSGYLWKNWHSFCGDFFSHGNAVQPVNPDGNNALIASSTGYGDGGYPVFELSNRTDGVTGLMVEFINTDDD